MTFAFCPHCGAALVEKPIGDEGLVPYCESCARPHFSFSYACVICCVFDPAKEQVLLIRQSYGEKRYVCVAGYVKQGETIEETAAREVLEETGLTASSLRYVRSYYYPKRDQLMFGFAVQAAKSDICLSCEVEEAQWFSVAEAREQLREAKIAAQLLEDALH